MGVRTGGPIVGEKRLKILITFWRLLEKSNTATKTRDL